MGPAPAQRFRLFGARAEPRRLSDPRPADSAPLSACRRRCARSVRSDGAVASATGSAGMRRDPLPLAALLEVAQAAIGRGLDVAGDARHEAPQVRLERIAAEARGPGGRASRLRCSRRVRRAAAEVAGPIHGSLLVSEKLGLARVRASRGQGRAMYHTPSSAVPLRWVTY